MSPQQDPGLQPQRTALAWGRTGLSMAAVALLVLRAGVQGHRPAVLAVGTLDMACAVLLCLAAGWRRSALGRETIRPVPPAWMAGISAAVALACLAGAWLVLQ